MIKKEEKRKENIITRAEINNLIFRQHKQKKMAVLAGSAAHHRVKSHNLLSTTPEQCEKKIKTHFFNFQMSLSIAWMMLPLRYKYLIDCNSST
jgi:hypothetical protein